jgi:hypothetical protein
VNKDVLLLPAKFPAFMAILMPLTILYSANALNAAAGFVGQK